jgi:hypothetical protein
MIRDGSSSSGQKRAEVQISISCCTPYAKQHRSPRESLLRVFARSCAACTRGSAIMCGQPKGTTARPQSYEIGGKFNALVSTSLKCVDHLRQVYSGDVSNRQYSLNLVRSRFPKSPRKDARGVKKGRCANSCAASATRCARNASTSRPDPLVLMRDFTRLRMCAGVSITKHPSSATEIRSSAPDSRPAAFMTSSGNVGRRRESRRTFQTVGWRGSSDARLIPSS